MLNARQRCVCVTNIRGAVVVKKKKGKPPWQQQVWVSQRENNENGAKIINTFRAGVFLE